VIGAIPIWYLVEMEGFSKTDTDSSSSSGDEEDEGLPRVDEDFAGEILAGDEPLAWDADEEALDIVDGPPLSRQQSRRSGERRRSSHIERFERRLSSPIGFRGEAVGPGGGRRLSNGLAASNMGQGTGGTSFA